MRKTYLYKLLPLLNIRIKVYVFLMIILTIYNIISIIENYYYGLMIDMVEKGEMAWYPAILVVLITIAEYALSISSSYINAVIREEGSLNVRNAITAKLTQTSSKAVSQLFTGDYVTRALSDTELAIAFWAVAIPNMYGEFIMMLAGIILCLHINVMLTLFGFMLVPIVFFINFKISKPVERSTLKSREALGVMGGILRNIVMNITTIKSFSLHHQMQVKFKTATDLYVKAETKAGKVKALLEPFGALVYFLPNWATMIVGGILIANDKLTAGGYITFLFTFIMVSGVLQTIRTRILDIRNSEAYAKRVYSIIELPIEIITEFAPTKVESENMIICEDVNFSYDNENTVLKNINFKIQKGKVTAFVGHSGSGKSTIVKLLSGLYLPLSGTINMFGDKLNKSNLSQIRKRISVVAQENYIFSDTIRNNIVLDKKGVSDDILDDVCKKAEIYDFIMSLKSTYDTVLTESGTNISGGQKQRLCIARAFLHNRQVLILDEPTSSLDMITEVQLQKTLNTLTKDKTVIVIAHKLSTIKSADMIYVMDRGEIVASGTHDQLIKEKVYYDMYKYQEAAL